MFGSDPRNARASCFVIVGLALGAIACSFDTDRAVERLPPPIPEGRCGTTATLFPRLLAFLREGRFAPLRDVLERRLLPAADGTQPDLSLKTVFAALVRVVSQLGLDQTAYFVDVAAKEEVEEELGPLISAALKLIDGRFDGVPRYEAGDAAAHFVARCDPDHLLTAIEGGLRLKSAQDGRPWVLVALEATVPLLEDPQLQPFLASFERNAETGKPAVVSLLAQIMGFLGDENFAISRVQTLLDSAVYPFAEPELEAKIRVLVDLMDEATSEDAGILQPLQRAVRCGMMHPEQRDVLLGLVFDVVVEPELGAELIVQSASGVLVGDALATELDLIADVVHVMRDDLSIRDDLQELTVMLLSQPESQRVVPVIIELIDRLVFAELVGAIVTLLDGCGRA